MLMVKNALLRTAQSEVKASLKASTRIVAPIEHEGDSPGTNVSHGYVPGWRGSFARVALVEGCSDLPDSPCEFPQ